jgi:hypothetical protein
MSKWHVVDDWVVIGSDMIDIHRLTKWWLGNEWETKILPRYAFFEGMKRYPNTLVISFVSKNWYGSFNNIKNKLFITKMHVGLKQGIFYQGLRLTHELDGRLLSNDFLKVINWDMGIGFGQTIPCWKFNLMRKIMEQVSIGEIVHNSLRKWKKTHLCFHGLLINLLGTLTSQAYNLRSRTPNITQED